jgi:hypothetical protein
MAWECWAISAFTELDAAGQGAQAGRGGGSLDLPGGLLPEPPTGADQARRGQATQPAAEAVRGSDHQGVELALGVGGRLDRRAPCGQPHRQCRAMAGRAGLGELVTGQGLAGRPGGVQGIGLGAVAAGGSLGSVQLQDLLGLSGQEPGQASTVAAGASIAHTRRPSCRLASRSSCWEPAGVAATVTCSSMAPLTA